jgi:hypothetical protein
MPDEEINKEKEKPDDPVINNEINDQTQKLAEVANLQEDIINKNEDNKTMEVPHTHAHHNFEGKKIKEYFYEFFMLFLAVTAGFFVENWREYITERHREKQFIESLVRDLANDTTSLADGITSIRNQLRGTDTLLRVMENPKEEKIIEKIYYYTNRYVSVCTTHTPTDRTISQLKNAGGLRLILNKAVSDSIVAYDEANKGITISGDFNLKLFYDFMKREKELFEVKIFRLNKVDIKDINAFLNLKGLVILNDSPHWMDYFYNDVIYYGSVTNQYYVQLKDLKKKANNLIKFLKKEYDIK